MKRDVFRVMPLLDSSLASIDLSWAQVFHSVNVSRWSEPPGPSGYECSSWRVVVGAFGRYVSANDRDLRAAIAQALEKVAEDPRLRELLPEGLRRSDSCLVAR